jgi:Xaa-Pro aminopeptidase
MTISNEPGYYERDGFGIRIENILYSKVIETPNHFNNVKYLGFENLTLVPIQTSLIQISQLTDEEIAYLNRYHITVRETLLSLMVEYFPESVDYLFRACEPISRA